jgi:hypothetical protein
VDSFAVLPAWLFFDSRFNGPIAQPLQMLLLDGRTYAAKGKPTGASSESIGKKSFSAHVRLGEHPSRTIDCGWKINSTLSDTMMQRSEGGREYDKD